MVVFPDPFSPNSAIISPCLNVHETLSKTQRFEKDLLRFFTSNIISIFLIADRKHTKQLSNKMKK